MEIVYTAVIVGVVAFLVWYMSRPTYRCNGCGFVTRNPRHALAHSQARHSMEHDGKEK